LLKKHPKKNIDCVCIIDALDHVVDLIQISEERKLLEDEKKEDENKRETTH
jgi:hypothetical protein